MASDRMDTKAWRDLNAQLNRIALAAERMADAMEKYVENDPLAAVTKALEAETQATPQEAEPMYGSDLPESERWRLGS